MSERTYWKKHGLHKISEYNAWVEARQRCNNPRDNQYADYGARGIKICKRWESFENFFADMGYKPGKNYSLDRKNNNGNYTPSNCRWATVTEQARNRRSTKLTIVKARKIREAYRSGGVLLREIAVTFKVSRGLVGLIVNNKIWKEGQYE